MPERTLKSGRTWSRLAMRWAWMPLIIFAFPLKERGEAVKAEGSAERPPSFQELITSTTTLKPLPVAMHRTQPGTGAEERNGRISH